MRTLDNLTTDEQAACNAAWMDYVVAMPGRFEGMYNSDYKAAKLHFERGYRVALRAYVNQAVAEEALEPYHIGYHP